MAAEVIKITASQNSSSPETINLADATGDALKREYVCEGAHPIMFELLVKYAGLDSGTVTVTVQQKFGKDANSPYITEDATEHVKTLTITGATGSTALIKLFPTGAYSFLVTVAKGSATVGTVSFDHAAKQ